VEGTAQQAAQKEEVDTKKKKRAEKAWSRHEKEKEITLWVWVRENRSDMEVELESEEPMEMCDDVSSLEGKEDRGVAVTLVERRKPTAAPVGGGHGTKVRGDVPESRKLATLEDAALE